MHKRYSKRKPPTTPAFTIIELLIVIVVIGILATITIIAYSGIQQRAHTAALTSSLSQAATKLKTYDIEIGSYPESLTDINIHSSEAVTYIYYKDNNSNPRSFCITAIKNNLVYKVTDTTQPSPGGCGMHEWPGGVVMTNLVVNSDFSNDTAGWSMYGGVSANVVGGVVQITRTTGQLAIFQGGLSLPAGNKYYGRLGGVSTNMSDVYVYVSNTFVRIDNTGYSGIVTSVSATGSAVFGRAVYVDGTYLNIDNAVLINLTATFGAGNEPTKEQMDQILQQFPNSWFDGTVTASTQGIL